MGTWEAIALTGLGILVVMLFRPGLRAAMEKSRQAQNQDWQSLLAPILLVILFVMLLITLAKSTGSKRTVEPDDLIDTHAVQPEVVSRWS
jgi:cytochrome b561